MATEDSPQDRLEAPGPSEAGGGEADGEVVVTGHPNGGPAGATEVPTPTTEEAAQELAQLRAELATARVRNAELEQTRARRRLMSLSRGSSGRRILSTVLVVLAVILTPVSVLAVWTANTLIDTNQYVTTVTPLASNPDIQAAVTNRVTNEIYSNIDVKSIVAETLPPKAAVLAGPLGNALKGFIHEVVGRVVTSQQFEKLWVNANRIAHAQLVGALEGKSSGGLSVKNGEVTLDLHQLVTQVKQQLSSAGLTVVDRIPTNRISGTVTLFQSTAVTRAQAGFNLLNTLGDWLPVIVLVLLALGVWLARDRRRALVAAGLGVVVAMLVFGGAVSLARGYYINRLPPSVSRPAMTAALDIIFRFLRQAFWAMFALGLIIAVAAFLAGPSLAARGIRHGLGSGMGWLGDRAERARLLPAGLRVFMTRYRRAWEIGVLAVAVLVLLLWRGRTVAVELWTVFVTVIALLLVQLLGRRSPPELAVPPETAAARPAEAPETGRGEPTSPTEVPPAPEKPERPEPATVASHPDGSDSRGDRADE